MKQTLIILSISILLISCLSETKKQPQQEISVTYTPYHPKDLSFFDSIPKELKDTIYHMTRYGEMHYDLAQGSLCQNEPYSIYYPYQYLKNEVDIPTLIKLTDYPHPYIRLYAFTALSERDSTHIFDIITSHLMDTCKIENSYADMGSWDPVVDLMLYQGIEMLSKEQKDSLKDIIFFDYSFLISYYYLLPHLAPEEKYYKQIRNDAIGYYSYPSIVALSKYKKQKDIPIIKQAFKTEAFLSHNWHTAQLFQAISYFPDTAFLELLLNYPETVFEKSYSIYNEFNYFYPALAQYKCKESITVFEECVSPKHYRMNGYLDINKAKIIVALEDNYDTIYSDLFKKLKSEVSENEIRYARSEKKRDSDSMWN